MFSIATLIIVFFIKLLLILTLKPVYWNDEMIIAEISKQDVFIILNLILAERHPPLFYFLVKFIPTDKLLLTRIILTIFNHGLILAVLLQIKKVKTFFSEGIDIGLSLFLVSASFFIMSGDLKSQVLSLPLVFYALYLIYRYKKDNLNFAFNLNIIFSLILLNDYFDYIFITSLFAVRTFIEKDFQTLRKVFIFQTGIFSIFFFIFLKNQMILNIHNFAWVSAYSESNSGNFLRNLITQFTAYESYTLFPFAIFCLSLSIIGLFGIYKKTDKSQFFLIFLYIVGIFYLNSLFGFFIRARYSYFLFLLICLLSGIGLSVFLKNKKAIFAIIFAYLLIGANGYIKTKIHFNNFTYGLKSELAKESEPLNVGFITNGQNVFPYVFNRYYLSQKNVIPINYANGLVFSQKMTQEDILAARDPEWSQNLLNTIKDNKINTIFYTDNMYLRKEEYHYLVEKELNLLCKNKAKVEINKLPVLLKYSNCY